MAAVVGGHVGVAGADVLVAGGARRHAAAALAAGAACPQAHLRPPRLAAPVPALRPAIDGVSLSMWSSSLDEEQDGDERDAQERLGHTGHDDQTTEPERAEFN